MKRTLLIALLALLCAQAETQASPALWGKPGLEVSCMLSANGIDIKDYRIFIFENGKFKDSLYADLALPIYLQFELNKKYSLKFCKPGYLERIVLVETNVPEEKAKTKFTYDFDIEMIPADSGANTLGDLPVALISYDADLRQFDYSLKYAESVGHLPETPPALPAETPDKRAERKKGVVPRNR